MYIKDDTLHIKYFFERHKSRYRCIHAKKFYNCYGEDKLMTASREAKLLIVVQIKKRHN